MINYLKCNDPIKGLVLIACMCGALFQMAVYLFLPAFVILGADLNASPAKIQNTIFIYMVGSAIGQLLGGVLVDKYNINRVIIYTAWMTAISFFTMAFVHYYDFAYSLRLMQGFGLGVCMTAMRIILRKFLNGVHLASAFIKVSMAFAISAMIAPFIGSQIIEYFSWRLILIILVILTILYAYLSDFFLQKSITGTSEELLLDKSNSFFDTFYIIITSKQFMSNCIGGSIAYGVTISIATISPYLFMNTLHYNPQQFGYIALVPPAGYLVGSLWGSRAVLKLGQEYLIKVALRLIAFSGVIMLLFNSFGALNGLVITILGFGASAGQAILFGNSLGLALRDFSSVKSINYASAIFGFIQSCLMGLTALLCSTLPSNNSYGLATIFISIAVICKQLIKPR